MERRAADLVAPVNKKFSWTMIDTLTVIVVNVIIYIGLFIWLLTVSPKSDLQASQGDLYKQYGAPGITCFRVVGHPEALSCVHE